MLLVKRQLSVQADRPGPSAQAQRSHPEKRAHTETHGMLVAPDRHAGCKLTAACCHSRTQKLTTACCHSRTQKLNAACCHSRTKKLTAACCHSRTKKLTAACCHRRAEDLPKAPFSGMEGDLLLRANVNTLFLSSCSSGSSTLCTQHRSAGASKSTGLERVLLHAGLIGRQIQRWMMCILHFSV